MAIYFTVEGRGEFPWDMLRHDECWPTTSDDVARMMPRYEVGDDHKHLGRRRVRLGSNRRPELGPSVLRWESFTWKVVPEAVIARSLETEALVDDRDNHVETVSDVEAAHGWRAVRWLFDRSYLATYEEKERRLIVHVTRRGAYHAAKAAVDALDATKDRP